MAIENCVVTLVTTTGKQTKEVFLDTDPKMLNWAALQYADVNSAQVTIRNMDGKVLAFTGNEPV